METTSFFSLSEKGLFLLRCLNARSKKDDLGGGVFSLHASFPSLLLFNPESRFSLSPLYPPPPAHIQARISARALTSTPLFLPVLPAPVGEERQPEQLPAQRFQPPEYPHRLARTLIRGSPPQRERGSPAPVSASAKSAIAGLPCRRNDPEKAGPL